VLERFAAQLIADRQAICAAVSAADVSAVARTAHRLKGAAGAVAADRLHALAAVLESHAKNGQLQAVALELESLIDEIERCAAYLPVARRAASAAGSRQVGDCQQRNQRCGS
jgi:HPt (histidine-containing phosphotransfer) domain-containing protein